MWWWQWSYNGDTQKPHAQIIKKKKHVGADKLNVDLKYCALIIVVK